MLKNNIRFDYYFSYWLFTWFILYIYKIIHFNPLYPLIISLFVNIIQIILFIYYKINYKYILFFIFINIFLKIIPIYIIYLNNYSYNDFIFFIILFTMYILWLKFNNINIFNTFNKQILNIKNKNISTPLYNYLHYYNYI